MKLKIKEAKAQLISTNPLEWRGGMLPSGKRTASITCVNGHIASLSKHAISESGEVSPSVVCPYDDCGFHEFVILQGWQA